MPLKNVCAPIVEVLSIYEDLERIEPTESCPIRRYLLKLQKTVQTSLQFKPVFYR